MQGDKDILYELGTISPVVAGIGLQETYRVPDAYFETLAEEILARLGAVYQVPPGFFDGFAGKLMTRIKAEEAASTEAGSAREELQALSPVLAGLDRKLPYTTPAGFFSEFPDSLIAGVSNRITPVSPLLSGLQSKQTYLTPEGYFERLADLVVARVNAGSVPELIPAPAAAVLPVPAPVIAISSRSRWIKYAVAAVLTGFLMVSGLWIYNNNKQPGTNGDDVSTKLAKISDQEILNYLETDNEPLTNAVTNSTAILDISDSDIKDLLGDIPDAELKQFVDEHGNAQNPITN